MLTCFILAILVDRIRAESGPILGDGASVAPTCQEARNECQISHTCGLQYHSVLIRCPTTSSNGSREDCTEDCQLALRNLEHSSKEGYLLTHCECSPNDPENGHFCHSHNAIFLCAPGPDEFGTPTDGTLPVACNDARRYCENDWVCREALHYYEVVCEQFLRGTVQGGRVGCSAERCRESFQILMRQKLARSLAGCRCDMPSPGPSGVYCFRITDLPDCTELVNGSLSQLAGEITYVFALFMILLTV